MPAQAAGSVLREVGVARAGKRSRKGVRPRPRGVPRLSAECEKLLQTLRKRCPELLPRDPIAAGTVGPEVVLKRDEVQRLVSAAADADHRGLAVWTSGDSELLVYTGKVSVQLGAGLVLVSIPVQCAEAGTAEIQVPFAVGDEKQPAGMFAATEERPRGPAIVVELWGDALIAFAWKILLSVATGAAAAAGRDLDGNGLIPAALTVNADLVRVLTQARHTFDRVKP
jgi:hypothetical protein